MKVLTPNDVGPEVLDEPCVVVIQTSLRCHPCKKMYPWLDKLAKKLGDRAKVVRVTAHQDERPMRYTRGVERLSGWPYTMVFKEGVLVHHFYGFKSEGEYIKLILSMVN